MKQKAAHLKGTTPGLIILIGGSRNGHTMLLEHADVDITLVGTIDEATLAAYLDEHPYAGPYPDAGALVAMTQ